MDLSSLLGNDQFQVGLGLLGASQPGNPAMANAYKVLQERRQFELEQALKKQQMEVQKAMVEQHKQQTELYGAQVKGQLRHLDQQSAMQAMVAPFIQNILKGQGNPGAMQPPQIPGINGPAQPSPQPQGGMQPGMPPMQQSTLFPWADKFVAGIEGGYNPNDAGKGPTNFGINQKANPDINVKNLTPETAAQVRQTRYWKAINGDSLPPPTAAVAYDAAINQGPQYAQSLLQKTGGDPALMLYQRRQDYEQLAKSNPIYAQQLQGWKDRLDQLSEHIKNVPKPPVPGVNGQLNPSQQMGMMGGLMQLAAGDVPKGFEALANALKPDYKPQELGIQQQQANTAAGHLTVAQQAETRAAAEKEQQRLATKAADIKAFKTADLNLGVLNGKVSELIQHPGLPGIYGKLGMFPDVPGSDAANARVLQKSIVAQQAKETLTAMRDASKTGGALGNVSDADVTLLKEALYNLESSQSQESAVKAMGDVQKYTHKLRNNMMEVYEKQYQESPLGQGIPVGTRYYGVIPSEPKYDPKTWGKPVYIGPNGKKFILGD